MLAIKSGIEVIPTLPRSNAGKTVYDDKSEKMLGYDVTYKIGVSGAKSHG